MTPAVKIKGELILSPRGGFRQSWKILSWWHLISPGDSVGLECGAPGRGMHRATMERSGASENQKPP